MPSGIYIRTEKHKKKIALSRIGRKHSEETKKKMRENNHMSEEARKRASDRMKNRHISLETRQKLRDSLLGKPSRASKGGITFNKKYLSWIKNKRNRDLRTAVGSHTFGEWENLKAQYNWTCPCCKIREPKVVLTQDHIIPVSKGGSNNIENIQPLCRSCNSKKNNKILKY